MNGVWLLWAASQIVWASIECPLKVNDDDLLLIGDVEFILDTGAADTIMVQPGGLVSHQTVVVKYQTLALEKTQMSHSVDIGGCSAPFVVPRVHDARVAKKYSIGNGILGLGRAGDAMLFSPEMASWNTLSITVAPNGGGMLILKDSHLRPSVPTLPLTSRYYWAADLSDIRIGYLPVKLPRKTAVIFDTGSNFFGLSPGLYTTVTDSLRRQNCRVPLIFGTTSTGGRHVDLAYPPEIYALQACELAIGQIDQSHFGDLANHEVVIIGTRGLKGKTLSIHKSSKNENGFLISIN